MKLDDAQKKTVIGWIEQGLKLAEIQKKLGTEMGLNPTYMEVRFLVDDLKVLPKDPEPPKKAEPVPTAKAAGPVGEDDFAEEPADGPAPDVSAEAAPVGTGQVSVSLDQITRPGAMISGKVTFANGKSCEWMLDQMGRLGVVPAEDGYKPTAAELRDFQIALQSELRRMGY